MDRRGTTILLRAERLVSLPVLRLAALAAIAHLLAPSTLLHGVSSCNGILRLAACLAVGHARSHRALNCFPAHARIRTRLIRTMLLEQHSERLRSQFLVLLDSLNHASRTGESCLDGCEALVDEHDQRLQNGFAHGLAVVCELERHALAGGALRDSE
jgi:hypothetical protein